MFHIVILHKGQWSLPFPLLSPIHSLLGDKIPDSNLSEYSLHSALADDEKTTFRPHRNMDYNLIYRFNNF